MLDEVVSRLALLVALVGCSPNDDQHERVDVEVAPAPHAAIPPTHPSIAFYPSPDPELGPSLAAGEPFAILRALGSTFAPHRPKPEDWDRTGFIRLGGDPSGFVRLVDGSIAPQIAGRYDLSCAGGFLEGVRLLLLPDVELDGLGQCDAELLAAVSGTPPTCDHAGDFGTIALANIALRLSPERLPSGRTLHATAVRTRSDVRADVPSGQARLCTVSHASRARGGVSFDHHMMIMFAPDERGQIPLFDTTGSRGVALRPREPAAVAKYIKHLLADNDLYVYDPATAELTCLDVAL